MDANAMQQDSHMAEMKDGQDSSSVMAPKSVFEGMDLKVGDEVTLTVKGMEGDMIELMPADDHSEMSSDDMQEMSKDDAEAMPLDEMEKRLPKAKREY